MKKFLLIFLICTFPTFAAFAEPMHGLSLYGPEGLKYSPGQPYEYANPKAPKGGSLTLGAFGAFTKLNPLSLKGVPASGLGGLVFQSPMDSSSDDDEPFSQYGNLVESVDLAEDRMSMIYHIYKNAKFSDGHPVTADDFVFSFELIKHPEYHPVYKEYFKDIKSATKIDEHTVKYTFAIYNQELPLITGQMSILPKHIYGAPGKNFGSDFDEMAIGSGPYVVDKFDFGKFITLKRNPDWWAKDLGINQGRYNFDTITWKVYLDPVAIREAVKGGEVDANQIGSSRDWALDYQGSAQKKGYYLRKEFPHNRVAGMQGFVLNTRNDILKSRRVRAAIAMAFDFEWSNKNLFYNQYTRNECYFDNNKEMKATGLPQGNVKKILIDLKKKYPKHVPKTVFTKPVGAPGQGLPVEKNLAVAKTLLKSAGWKPGKSGLLEKNGKPFRLIYLNDNPQWMRIVEPFQSNLRKLGIELEIKTVQPAEYEERTRDYKFDMIVFGYGQSRSPGNEQRSMWSSEAADTPGSRNFAGIKNPAIDELIEKLIQAKTRRGLVDHIQAMDRILTHQFYLVPHWYIPYDRAVYWNKFSHPENLASQTPFLNNFLEWWWWDEAKAQKLKQARAKGSDLN